MKIDLEKAAELAAELSGIGIDYFRKLMRDARAYPRVDLHGAKDPTWLRRQPSGWIIHLVLARLGETLHPILAAELNLRVATIREVRNDADARWLTSSESVEFCWRTLRTAQQLAATFDPGRRSN